MSEDQEDEDIGLASAPSKAGSLYPSTFSLLRSLLTKLIQSKMVVPSYIILFP